jgi:hypothetical protein
VTLRRVLGRQKPKHNFMVFVSSLYVIHDVVCFSNIGPVGTEETTALKQASEWGMIGIQSS